MSDGWARRFVPFERACHFGCLCTTYRGLSKGPTREGGGGRRERRKGEGEGKGRRGKGEREGEGRPAWQRQQQQKLLRYQRWLPSRPAWLPAASETASPPPISPWLLPPLQLLSTHTPPLSFTFVSVSLHVSACTCRRSFPKNLASEGLLGLRHVWCTAGVPT